MPNPSQRFKDILHNTLLATEAFRFVLIHITFFAVRITFMNYKRLMFECFGVDEWISAVGTEKVEFVVCSTAQVWVGERDVGLVYYWRFAVVASNREFLSTPTFASAQHCAVKDASPRDNRNDNKASHHAHKKQHVPKKSSNDSK